ncbi:MAG: sigma-70 family RNA polymerase sigma factor [Oscillospiraceae bacterium]|jgi:hypothetical protein|nr:sigma-70 family RNA polymerase sigma factor [Oscillospiraceae bacterium]
MQNYQKNDYAVNKEAEGIVYRFVTGETVTITVADYLLENPDKTEKDFIKLKKCSDKDYYKRDRAENNQTWKNISIDNQFDLVDVSAKTPEELVIEVPYQEKESERREIIGLQAIEVLTETQRRRYKQYHVDGLSTWKIAKMESKNQKSIYESLQVAEKKIKDALM